MNKPHKHAEFIKAWADGAEIECTPDNGTWFDDKNPTWDIRREYRVKQTPKWPLTTMTASQLYKSSGADDSCFCVSKPQVDYPVHSTFMGNIANATLAHALETGQVVLPEKKNYVDQLDYTNGAIVKFENGFGVGAKMP